MIVITLISVLVVILIGWTMAKDDEELLILKLIGYLLLGGFSFGINGFPIPLGFIIFLFLNINENSDAKTFVHIAGLIGLIINFLFF
ncbi:hypothetical protein DS745_03820 [Anaerobacillus alkaliphilus]|uniref:Uncharacterized protein n=1 Tax=Anaerobacillus alkaliphilus TaxID=1548597 RepID=A0A4Q0W1S1_9BACI|nr:hypothetical protein [Anaerobacillus alkaliphilus]RXJ04521.1 hypothetical protein DS745_03820 [Anaerobacillus alkaliphilus]